MIHKLLFTWYILLAVLVQAITAQTVEDELERHRMPVQQLSQSVLAKVGRASLLHWRQSKLILSLELGQLLELNTFESSKIHILARLPGDYVNWQFGVGGVIVSSSTASEIIAKTPYRQPGRPSRQEIDFGIDMPYAEAVGNQLLTVLPPFQLVFSLQTKLRYLMYIDALSKLKASKILTSLLKPTLSQEEVNYLEKHAVDGLAMQKLRLDALVGWRFDVYTQRRINIYYSTLLALPLSQLRYWWDMSLGFGYVF